jgi:ribonuclease-3
LLEQALVHRSYRFKNNERLEFLGDAILSLVISDYLYRRFAKAKEGQLTRLRAYLVNGEMLSEIGFNLKLNHFILVGQGERLSGGFKRKSIIADALEAIIGAIYLDAGLAVAQHCILDWLKKYLAPLALNDIEKDPKTQLQEYCQANKQALPDYELMKIEGQAHDQLFYVTCKINLAEPILGMGKSRRLAEQVAAKKALEYLKNE